MTATHAGSGQPGRYGLLLVHAHPDDESIATGGVIARYASAGVPVTVVTCTLGEEGEVIGAELQGLSAQQADQLGGYRMTELRDACAALGVTQHRFLGGVGRWRDSGMVPTGEDGRALAPDRLHPRALVAGDLAEQTDELVAILAELRPAVVVTYGPDGGYGHPDHIRAHQITMAALPRASAVTRAFWVTQPRGPVDAGADRLRAAPDLPFARPAPGWIPASDDAEVSTEIDIRPHLTTKLAGMTAHETQVTVWRGDPPAYALSNGVGQPLLDREYFILASGPAEGTEFDLFGGPAA